MVLGPGRWGGDGREQDARRPCVWFEGQNMHCIELREVKKTSTGFDSPQGYE